jgi:hypothetical protein
MTTTGISKSPGRILAVALFVMLASGPAISASPNVEAAIKSLGAMQADAGKFQSYCALLGEMEGVPETDTAKYDELEGRLEDLIESFGPDVAKAWELAADIDAESEDGKALAAAFEEMEAKCP